MKTDLTRSERALLKKRALVLARRRVADVEQSAEKIVVMNVNGTHIAFDATSVEEAVTLDRFATFPQMRPSWHGVLVHRGIAVCLIDLGLLLDHAKTPEPRVALIVNSTSGPLGVLGQELVGLWDVTPSMISEELTRGSTLPPFVSHIHKDLTRRIDVNLLAADPQVSGRGVQKG